MAQSEGDNFMERFEQRKKAAKQRLHLELDSFLNSVVDDLCDFFLDEFKSNGHSSPKSICPHSVSALCPSSESSTPLKRSEPTDILHSFASQQIDIVKKLLVDERNSGQLKQGDEINKSIPLSVQTIKKEVPSDSDEGDLSEIQSGKRTNDFVDYVDNSETECDCSDCAEDDDSWDFSHRDDSLNVDATNVKHLPSTSAQINFTGKKDKRLCKRRSSKPQGDCTLAAKKLRTLLPKVPGIYNSKQNNTTSTNRSVVYDPKKPSLMKCLHEEVKCPQMFMTKSALFCHLLASHQPIPWQCLVDKCEKSFMDKKDLLNHAQMAHFDIIKWQCHKCAEKFDQFDHLHHHALIECPPLLMHLYSKRLIEHYVLVRHQFICSDEQCTKVYNNKYALKQHEQNSHGIFVPKSKRGRKKKPVTNGTSITPDGTKSLVKLKPNNLAEQKHFYDSPGKPIPEDVNPDLYCTDSEETNNVLDFIEVILNEDESSENQQLQADSEGSYNEPQLEPQSIAISPKIVPQPIQPSIPVYTLPGLSSNTPRQQPIMPSKAKNNNKQMPTMGKSIPKPSSRIKCPQPECRTTEIFKAKSALFMHLINVHHLESQQAMHYMQ